jgi:hypothetical protein
VLSVDGVIPTHLRSVDSRVALLREIGLRAASLVRPDVGRSAIPAITLDDAPAIHDVMRNRAAGRKAVPHGG